MGNLEQALESVGSKQRRLIAEVHLESKYLSLGKLYFKFKNIICY